MTKNVKTAAAPDISNAASASVLPMLGLCPHEDRLTEQDVRNMPLYTWLLIAEEDGASVEELATNILRFDLAAHRRWAIQVTRSYLDRARWVNERIFPTIG
ncbi:MAG TPA: hypothetical protein VMF58_13060 [Rhizomicrobium sp.]|nr:hypothetical protein [Rhizomicrobium sp.]